MEMEIEAHIPPPQAEVEVEAPVTEGSWHRPVAGDRDMRLEENDCQMEEVVSVLMEVVAIVVGFALQAVLNLLTGFSPTNSTTEIKKSVRGYLITLMTAIIIIGCAVRDLPIHRRAFILLL
ncbi:hypothetical protein OROGR_020871 [Orobanche gracilis]